MIKKYNPIIYPLNIYIGIDEDVNNLLKDFTSSSDGEHIYSSWSDSHGLSYSHILDSNNEYCLVMIFEKEVSLDLVVHELAHIVYRLWEHIGETEVASEANAYLHEWVMKCYLDFIKEYNGTSLENK